MHKLLAEAGIVHGSGFEVLGDTYRMSTGTSFNAQKAAELLATNSVDKVICCGQGPVHGDIYGATEAQLMADYLTNKGFDHHRIEIEDTSTSTVGNWVKSIPILKALSAESVLGITAKVNVRRMQLIGSFVAEQSGFNLMGYEPSAKKARINDCARELINYQLTLKFLKANTSNPIERLDEVYEAYKEQIGLAAIKRFIHRGVASTKTAYNGNTPV